MILLRAIGRASLVVMHDAGAMGLTCARIARGLVPPRFDRDELLRAMVASGEASLPIVVATAAFTGMIMVLQAASYVEQFGVYDLVGWYTGFSTFREVGPILVGLMVSGRVGANNTSELATMKVTEQIDALRVLALDPYELLVIPRTVAIVLATVALVIFGNLVSVLSGALNARLLMEIEVRSFLLSLTTRLEPSDFLVGVGKAAVFGFVIAVVSNTFGLGARGVSNTFGLGARGGSTGVGRAVNAQVVACAVTLFVADYLFTSIVR